VAIDPKALSPTSLKPLPRTHRLHFCHQRAMFCPSSMAREASKETNQRSKANARLLRGTAAADNAQAESTDVARNGRRPQVAAISSITTPASTQPKPLPPNPPAPAGRKNHLGERLQRSRESRFYRCCLAIAADARPGALSLIRPRAFYRRSIDVHFAEGRVPWDISVGSHFLGPFRGPMAKHRTRESRDSGSGRSLFTGAPARNRWGPSPERRAKFSPANRESVGHDT